MKDDLKRFDKDGMRFGQRLHIPYEKGTDPDDVYSSVAYDVRLSFFSASRLSRIDKLRQMIRKEQTSSTISKKSLAVSMSSLVSSSTESPDDEGTDAAPEC